MEWGKTEDGQFSPMVVVVAGGHGVQWWYVPLGSSDGRPSLSLPLYLSEKWNGEETFSVLSAFFFFFKAKRRRFALVVNWLYGFGCVGSITVICSQLALASDPSPLQDFSVAVPNNQAMVNGLACKDPKIAVAHDFSFSSLHLAGNTWNAVGSKVTPVTVAQLPGLNTLGISLARIDYASWGVNPPHTHPRASEILAVLLEIGFATSNPENRLITKVLNKGDAFVFPVGLVHYQRNVGYGNAVALAALSSQNPGVITIANAVFGSTPAIPSDLLAKDFPSG